MTRFCTAEEVQFLCGMSSQSIGRTRLIFLTRYEAFTYDTGSLERGWDWPILKAWSRKVWAECAHECHRRIPRLQRAKLGRLLP